MYPARIAIAPDGEQRRTSRRLVNFAGSLRDGAVAAVAVTVTNLTASGCRLTGNPPLEVDTAIWIKLAGMNTIRARVAWVGEGEAGCEFCTSLEEGEVADHVGRAPIARRLQFGTKRAKR